MMRLRRLVANGGAAAYGAAVLRIDRRGVVVAVKESAAGKPLTEYRDLWTIAKTFEHLHGDIREFAPSVGIPGLAYCTTAARLAEIADEMASSASQSASVVQFRRRYAAAIDCGGPMLHQLRIAAEAADLRNSESDVDVAALAQEEIQDTLSQLATAGESSTFDDAVRLALADMEDPAVFGNKWTMEVSGRAGGVEAGLFADELFDTFRAYFDQLGWRSEELCERGSYGGRQAHVVGDNVYWRMMHELGTHRVQRIPVTEASGRMQTSTAVVTMLPEIEAGSVNVKESDCEIEMVRGSGPGGQGVNSSSNAVRLKHKASGITIFCHESRSANENRERAIAKVAQQLWKQQLLEDSKRATSLLATQWASGERGERIRTYNFPQGRITDHRAKDWVCNRPNDFMKQAIGLSDLHDTLVAQHRATQFPAAADAAIGKMAALFSLELSSLRVAEKPKPLTE